MAPLSKKYTDSTGQRSKIHKYNHFYLYQISHVPVKENLCKTAVVLHPEYARNLIAGLSEAR